MPHVAIVTPSYLPDLERCALLAESVARFASSECRHVVIVPRRDRAEFSKRLEPYGTAVLLQEEMLPSWLLQLPFSRKWQFTPLGWPVRGWIRQQVVKIAYAYFSTADAVVFADSDTCLVRPFGAGLMLRPRGRVKLLAEPGVGDTPMHARWYRGASRLLGIAVKDYYGRGYIGQLVPWAPEEVRAMVRHIEAVSGRDWRTLLLHQKTLSEYVLYGLFVEEVRGLEASRHVREPVKPVIEYWDVESISDERLLQFLGTLTDEHVAIHIQSHASYSFDLYARTIRGLWQASGGR
jgi:hypothetical protein